MKLYLMRHSETDWNRLGLVQGHSDIHLNTNGMRLAAMTGDGMSDIPIDLCFTSPLARAQETAGLILARNGHYIKEGALTKLDERLMEINFGEWEGLHSNTSYREIDKNDYHRFFVEKEPEFIPKGAETLESVIARTNEFLEDICSRKEYEDKNILVMSHGCAIRCMLRQFYPENDYFKKPRVMFNCEAQIIDTGSDGRLFISRPNVLYYDESLAENLYAPKKQ